MDDQIDRRLARRCHGAFDPLTVAFELGARLVTGARVHRIETNARGLATGATWVDAEGAELLDRELAEMRGHRTLLVATHDPERVAPLQTGRLALA